MAMPVKDGELEMEELEGLVNVVKNPGSFRIGAYSNQPVSKTNMKQTHLSVRRSKLVAAVFFVASIYLLVSLWEEKDVDTNIEIVEVKHKYVSPLITDNKLDGKPNITLPNNFETGTEGIENPTKDRDLDKSNQTSEEHLNQKEPIETNVELTIEHSDITSNEVDEAAPTNISAETAETIMDETNEEKGSGKIPIENLTETSDVKDNSVSREEEKNAKLIETWGKWGFWDGEEDIRPTGDYTAKYLNRDIPSDEFPENAWQTDPVYVNHFLDAALNLITRAKEAMYTEYGYDASTLDDKGKVERGGLFKLEFIEEEHAKPELWFSPGWTNEKSLDLLAKRLLHAMMTNDKFTVVMGGHSAAAGHGNHFKQSYMMSFHHFMEPIFERLGMKLISRNLAQGGLGTLQSGLGSGSIYGDEIDMLLWDSGMTEKEIRALDLYYRQALLAGKRPPSLWGGDYQVLRYYHDEIGIDIGAFGQGYKRILYTKDAVQVKTLPFAVQYLQCEKQSESLCRDPKNKYSTQCWVDRPDVTPDAAQKDVSGKAGWHPGWRQHQHVGRIIAFTILTALEDAINLWSEKTMIEGMPLADPFWHISEFYESVQEKVRKIAPMPGNDKCETYVENGDLPERACKTPFKAATEFTPRANPETNSITSLIKAAPDGYVPSHDLEMLYSGPDVPNPAIELPEGEFDIRQIISNRRLRGLSNIVPGNGWYLDSKLGYCDGTYDAICGREPFESCLLSGHMDFRGGIIGDGLSGWLVLNIPKVKEGMIILKFHTWLPKNSNKRTDGWNEENNGNRKLSKIDYNSNELERITVQDRMLKEEPLPFCDDFIFQYSIDGTITTLKKDEFLEKMRNPQRVVEFITILDDEEMAGKERDIELGIRLSGCKREKVFSLTHVYWA